MCLRERAKERKKHLGCESGPLCVRARACESLHMHLLYCVWISCLRMHVFSLIRQIGVDVMRGDERRASWPWLEIQGSSDARLHQRCVAPVSPRHTHIL